MISVSQPWLRRRLRADQDVHDSDEFCEGLGSGIPSPGRDKHAVLDRDTSQRPTAVARQSPVPDGISAGPHLLRLVATGSAAGPRLRSAKTGEVGR